MSKALRGGSFPFKALRVALRFLKRVTRSPQSSYRPTGWWNNGLHNESVQPAAGRAPAHGDQV